MLLFWRDHPSLSNNPVTCIRFFAKALVFQLCRSPLLSSPPHESHWPEKMLAGQRTKADATKGGFGMATQRIPVNMETSYEQNDRKLLLYFKVPRYFQHHPTILRHTAHWIVFAVLFLLLYGCLEAIWQFLPGSTHIFIF